MCIGMIRIFIGFDRREAVAYSVLAHSLQVRASAPVTIAPVMLSQLGACFSRERHALQSTEFSFSRFLVPSLSGFEGWSIFMDCDMLACADIADLWALRNEHYAVQVVQHDHRPRERSKFLGQPQTAYAKKNWSSMMLLNNSRCRALTPEYVNTATGLELHQFKWLDGDHCIGALPQRWNHLVGYDPPDPDAAIVHYTLGGPWFEDSADSEYTDKWHAERARMLQVG
jgi:lipopolysaccharide biosynthesis glycosyltransferase